jgi:hypothetical protein
VWLPAGTAGSFAVRVRATNIAGDGVPGNGDSTDQDFALVVYNGERKDVPVATLGGVTISGGSDAFADPGETVSMRVAFQMFHRYRSHPTWHAYFDHFRCKHNRRVDRFPQHRFGSEHEGTTPFTFTLAET